jgi:hypothetical protein
MVTIFISHSSQDNDKVAELHRRLTEHGHLSVFLDFDPQQGIPATKNWESELFRHLSACDAVVALCSTISVASRWYFSEFRDGI